MTLVRSCICRHNNIKVILDVQLWELHQGLSETILVNTLTDVREFNKNYLPNVNVIYFHIYAYKVKGVHVRLSQTRQSKACKTLFGPIKSTNPSVRMAYKGHSTFGIIAIYYAYPACKTLFEPMKPTNQSIRMAYKGQSSFGKLDM